MRVLYALLLSFLLSFALGHYGQKERDVGRRGRPISPSGLSVARTEEDAADEDESFDMSSTNGRSRTRSRARSNASERDGSDFSLLDTPTPGQRVQVPPPVLRSARTGLVAASNRTDSRSRAPLSPTASNPSPAGRGRSHSVHSPGNPREAAPRSPSAGNARTPHAGNARAPHVNPLTLDWPIYAHPQPDSPNTLGRRHLLLNRQPEDRTHYHRPKTLKERRSRLSVDRRLDEPLHRWFIFDDVERLRCHTSILVEIKKLLLDLELSTNSHFVLVVGRPEPPGKKKDPLTQMVCSRTIDANDRYKDIADAWHRRFDREIAAPRRQEHLAMLELAQREENEREAERKRRNAALHERHKREQQQEEERAARARAARQPAASSSRQPAAGPVPGLGFHVAHVKGDSVLEVDDSPSPAPPTRPPNARQYTPISIPDSDDAIKPPAKPRTAKRRKVDSDSDYEPPSKSKKSKGKQRAAPEPEPEPEAEQDMFVGDDDDDESSVVEDSEPARITRQEDRQMKTALERSVKTATEEAAKRARERSGGSSSRIPHQPDNVPVPPPPVAPAPPPPAAQQQPPVSPPPVAPLPPPPIAQQQQQQPVSPPPISPPPISPPPVSPPVSPPPVSPPSVAPVPPPPAAQQQQPVSPPPVSPPSVAPVPPPPAAQQQQPVSPPLPPTLPDSVEALLGDVIDRDYFFLIENIWVTRDPSDYATSLRALNEEWGLGIPPTTLARTVGFLTRSPPPARGTSS